MIKNKQVDNFANAAKHPATTQDAIKLFRYLLLYWCLSGRLFCFAKRLPSTESQSEIDCCSVSLSFSLLGFLQESTVSPVFSV